MSVAIDLSGRVAFVTGGSRGLGWRCVGDWHVRVRTWSWPAGSFENCVEVADELTRETGNRAYAVAAHVGDWQGCEEAVQSTLAEFGHLDILINGNAGIAPLYESLESASEALFDKTIDVNLKGPFRMSTLFAPHMREGGSIVNVSSIASVRPKTTDLVYAAAKAGLNTMTKGLAQAYGPRVRVNTIMAGPFLTEISEASNT